MTGPSVYDRLRAADLMGMLAPLWKGGRWVLRHDGRLAPLVSGPDVNTLWHHVVYAWGPDCNTWIGIVHQHLSQARVLGRPFVPSPCHDCYKVVVRPRTLRELMALEELMADLGLPCKCGVETRAYVNAPYGGYFYNRGLEAGQFCRRRVRAAVDGWPGLGPDVPLILKRGCTEYEALCGPSDQWEIVPGQKDLERLVARWVVRGPTGADWMVDQPEWQLVHIHRKWIEFAWERGDPTAADFTAGRPLHLPPVTYGGEEEK